MRQITAGHAFDARRSLGDTTFTLDSGSIATIAPAASPPHDDIVVLPALVNAHDHARTIRTSSVGGFARPLEQWLHRLALFAPVDPYLATLAPLGRAALGGQGAVMIHHVRPMGLTDLPTEAAAMARAARDIGVRIAFGVGMRDQNPLVYGDHGPVLDELDPVSRAEIEARYLAPMLPVAEQIARVDAVAEAIAGPMVDVQYAPNGPQWGSDALWQAIAEASARTGRRVTTHLFETKYQRDWADRTYPGGLVKHWKEIGLLSPRLTLAHCVWARPDELEMIAEAGCVIASNTSSNLALRSGLAPVAEMVRRGCKVALGVDGQAFDEDDDALRELRLLWSLHAGWGFDTELMPRDVLAMALENGRIALGAPAGGQIAQGQAADLLILDRAALDEDALMPVDPLELMFARANRSHIRELIVAGRSVVSHGRVQGVDLDAVHDELRGIYRSGIAQRAGLAAALPPLERAVRNHYLARLGCC
ncbi:amidohydrolase family protein [Bosea sp. (in: a-proteobacteria)]|uniref:amidohydrolase family protein n=1 Tax=Bosea sp. (in: a-proteobacteria) TaxID=1871050 RepID=UPI0035676522